MSNGNAFSLKLTQFHEITSCLTGVAAKMLQDLDEETAKKLLRVLPRDGELTAIFLARIFEALISEQTITVEPYGAKIDKTAFAIPGPRHWLNGNYTSYHQLIGKSSQSICSWLEKLLMSQDIAEIALRKNSLSFAIVSPADLGFLSRRVQINQFFARAKDNGLFLCSPANAFTLGVYLSYLIVGAEVGNIPIRDGFYIFAMEPFKGTSEIGGFMAMRKAGTNLKLKKYEKLLDNEVTDESWIFVHQNTFKLGY
ncbi:MAG: hypothetical protein COX77_04965 [Candidatus Komeilibacteria bacterium CG_4_10_14_0_2_um_filter_37_10]|uniref:Uncharacterized protein n=1 Tax=Candidatus Komeilibacteria bacterium CG_4_10_14_0_2_um_filter_37_10 TaxID=1974470 RepID=A0A2M7VD57_9BACT|nr:MAG: hypothetical protein COX77_04965 [Candidatus Komeilibacteria bacterium CG_4_10_14_0_2_um_filter_37_10]